MIYLSLYMVAICPVYMKSNFQIFAFFTIWSLSVFVCLIDRSSVKLLGGPGILLLCHCTI